MVLWLPAAGMHRPSIPFYEVFSGLLTRLTIIFDRLELHARRTHEILNQVTDHFRAICSNITYTLKFPLLYNPVNFEKFTS